MPTKPLDAAAAAAYGWAADASDGDVLRESLALNGGARCASCDAVRSVDGFGGPGSNRLPLTFFDYCLIALLLRMHSGLPQVFGCFGHIPRKIGYPSRPKRGIGNPHLARHILNAHIVSFHQVQVPS